MSIKKIAFIGTGVMGAAMVARLCRAGYELSVYNRSREKAQETACATGASCADSIAQAVKEADLVITMVGYPDDVRQVIAGQGGVLASARPGSLIIDMTTSSPALARELYEAAEKAGLQILDAPVSGGDLGAREGTLSIMAGGQRQAFDRALPIFEVLGKNIVYMGPAGSGQHTKAANQIAVAGATAAMTEAIVYAEKAGLDPHTMLRAIGAGAAGSWQISNMAPRVLSGDHDPGFFIKHFIKDMRIVEEEMAGRGARLPMLHTVLELYERMAEDGEEDLGTQALIRLYRSDRLGGGQNH
ncbi:MAG: NAD(P)-dependent oxidoreductase [Clostridiaceae bacterium]|jgi:3-hydroxyisobutyrate dehydrogenase-like beta-hydroxyacid dehydrogenase|nr:NAD(P)-dependent oxidoreductase [Clostridiaceae bacterium]